MRTWMGPLSINAAIAASYLPSGRAVKRSLRATAGRVGLRRFGERRNERAAFRNHIPRARLRLAADLVQYQIGLRHEVLDMLMAIIDHVIGTQRADKLDAVLRRGDKYLSALFLREMADAAGPRVNQHALAALEAAVIKESLPGCQRCERHRACDRCVY
ncbi:MAG: hypothetical protein P4L92_03865 [Rudaea sp.]|nr:hypothetical protein [Rudaea sp.]